MPSLENATIAGLNEDQIDDVLYAARVGELEELKSTLAELQSHFSLKDNCKIYISAVDQFSGNNLLHYAAANGHGEVLKLVLNHENVPAEERMETNSRLISHQNSSGNTPLHYAAVNGQLDAAKLLVEAVGESARAEVLGLKNQAGYDAAFEAENASHEAVASFLNEHMTDTKTEGSEQDPQVDSQASAVVPEVATNGNDAQDVADQVDRLNMTSDQSG